MHPSIRITVAAAGLAVLVVNGSGCSTPTTSTEAPSGNAQGVPVSEEESVPGPKPIERPVQFFGGGFSAVPGTTRLLLRSRAAGDNHGYYTLWDYRTGEQLFQLRPSGEATKRTAPVISPDGRWMLNEDRELKLWDLQAGAEVRTFLPLHDDTLCKAFLPDSRHFITTGNDSRVFIWDRLESDDGRIGQFPAHEEQVRPGVANPVKALAVSPDGTLALTGDDEGNAILWRATDNDEPDDVIHRFPRVPTKVPPPPEILANSGVLDVGTGRVYRFGDKVSKKWASISAVGFFPDGRRVVVADDECLVRVFDVASGKELARLEKKDGWLGVMGALAVSPDGRHVLLAAEPAPKLWNIETGVVTELPGHYKMDPNDEGQTLDEPGGVWSVAFSPDGRLAITGGDDGTVRFWPVPSRSNRGTEP